MENKFPRKVRDILEGRAGNKCSICSIPTTGPGSEPNSILKLGDAAHIFTGAYKGPRFNPSLSPEQLCSADNGIWVCLPDHRKIDSDYSIFTVEILRGYKKKREYEAKHEFEYRSNSTDPSAILIELPYALTTHRLFEIISPQPYIYTTTSTLRELLNPSKSPSRVLDLASELIPLIWNEHPEVAGIVSTLLCTATNLWQPLPSVLDKLESLCDKAIQSDEWTRCASTEPLAFAVASKGRPAVHARLLERLINSSNWRSFDAARVKQYYGSIGTEIAAIMRHWNEPIRRGQLIRANDVHRIMDILLASDKTLLSTEELLNFLEENASVLKTSGELELAQHVIDFIAAFRFT